jgi:peptide-methionine (R)-S-oxide reductase
LSSQNEVEKNKAAQNQYPVKIDEQALAARIDPLSYDVLRNAATEQAFTGEYTDTETVGV